MKRRGFLTAALLVAIVNVSTGQLAPNRYINLEDKWDTDKVCHNPHKGWYIHYFDNGIKAYGHTLAGNDYLEDFPGLNDIYLRLAWSYLEPTEGNFNWTLLDKEIDRWTGHGYQISFRISCKEVTDTPYATPAWVEKAGAKGTWVDNGYSWEPDYGDPIFLQKLENFHKAFAARYAGRPWLEYVDIGSYGDWGEGHTAFSQRHEWPASVLKKHIDIYTRQYKNTVLVVSDDIVGSRESTDGSREEILDYIVRNGITLRDDGVSVKWFADRFGESTLRNPEFFELFWRTHPVNLELEHYDATVREDTWKKGVPFEKAIEEAHATYIGFHGYPRAWLKDNAALAARLANRAGYWYFLRTVILPEWYSIGKPAYIKLVFTNKGVAPAYHRYPLSLKLRHEASGRTYNIELPKVDNRTWMPGSFIGEAHTFNIPADAPEGLYRVSVKMSNPHSARSVLELPFIKTLREEDGAYTIGTVTLRR